MPSRRTLLTGAAAAGATALAGCSTGDALDPATKGDTPTAPDGATVVAAAESSLDADGPNGWFRLASRVYEHVDGDGSTTLWLVSEHGLVPGQNQHANNGWRLAELEVEHDYSRAAPAVGRTTDFRHVADGESAPVRLGRSGGASDDRHGWTIRFGDSGDSTWGATFATELDPDTTFEEGDPVSTVRARVREAKSWSFRDYAAGLTTELRYGEDR